MGIYLHDAWVSDISERKHGEPIRLQTLDVFVKAESKAAGLRILFEILKSLKVINGAFWGGLGWKEYSLFPSTIKNYFSFQDKKQHLKMEIQKGNQSLNIAWNEFDFENEILNNLDLIQDENNENQDDTIQFAHEENIENSCHSSQHEEEGESYQIDVNLAPKDRIVDLFKACGSDDLEAFEEILAHQYQIKDWDINQELNGVTLLYLACQQESLSIIEVLLKNGADINKPCIQQVTPLFLSSGLGLTKVVQMLLANNRVEPKKSTFEGITPLHVSCYEGKYETVKMLIENKSFDDLNEKTKDNATPLALASKNGYLEVIQHLFANDKFFHQSIEWNGKVASQIAKEQVYENICQLFDDYLQNPMRVRYELKKVLGFEGFLFFSFFFEQSKKKKKI